MFSFEAKLWRIRFQFKVEFLNLCASLFSMPWVEFGMQSIWETTLVYLSEHDTGTL
jgi:hypothetical protein